MPKKIKNIKFTAFKGFTLAEVLITLGIIGIVAEMTIPTLVQNFQAQATVVSLKKAYSMVANAYTMVVQDNGDPTNWNLIGYDDAQGAKNLMAIISPYLKILDPCPDTSKCYPAGGYKYLNNNYAPGFSSSDTTTTPAILSDGSIIYAEALSPTCLDHRGGNQQLDNVCAGIWIDINGLKKPNVMGQDLFRIYITKFGTIPTGTAPETSWLFSTSCGDKSSGYGCAAWVIYNENLDYLKCPGTLSWDGSKKCS